MTKDRWEINEMSSVTETEAKKALKVVRSIYSLSTVLAVVGFASLIMFTPLDIWAPIVVLFGMLVLFSFLFFFGENILRAISGFFEGIGKYRDTLKRAKKGGVRSE